MCAMGNHVNITPDRIGRAAGGRMTKEAPTLTLADYIVAMLEQSEEHAKDRSFNMAAACLRLATDAMLLLIAVETAEEN